MIWDIVSPRTAIFAAALTYPLIAKHHRYPRLRSRFSGGYDIAAQVAIDRELSDTELPKPRVRRDGPWGIHTSYLGLWGL